MSDKISEFDYQLIDPIGYHYKGEVIEGTFITLKAPSSKNTVECAQLKQAFFRAIPQSEGNVELSSSDKKEAEEALTGESIISLLSMSSKVDLSVVLLTAKKLFCSGIALMEGETKITAPIISEMSYDDLESMLGEYLVNFILASALKKMNSN